MTARKKFLDDQTERAREMRLDSSSKIGLLDENVVRWNQFGL